MKRPVPAPTTALFAALIALFLCAGCGHKPAQPPRNPGGKGRDPGRLAPTAHNWVEGPG